MNGPAYEVLGSFESLKEKSPANWREGRHEQAGFEFLPDINVSIQGIDANSSSHAALRLAREIRQSLEVEFEWRDKEGAEHRGRTGRIEWTPSRVHGQRSTGDGAAVATSARRAQ